MEILMNWSKGQRAIGMGKYIVLYSHILQDGKIKIGEGYPFAFAARKYLVLSGLVPISRYKDRKVRIGMGVSIPHSTSKENGCFIEEWISFDGFSVCQLVEKLGEAFGLVLFKN